MTEADRLADRVARTLLSREGTGPAWNLVIEEAREGYARVAMTVRDNMTNGHGIAHGGMIFSLADTAFAYACNSRNAIAVASSASIVFLSPVEVGEELIAEAREAMVSGRSGAYAVAVCTRDGRAIAHFHGQSRTIGGSIVEPEESMP